MTCNQLDFGLVAVVVALLFINAGLLFVSLLLNRDTKNHLDLWNRVSGARKENN